MPAPRGMFAALTCLLVLVAAAAGPAASVTWPASTGLLVAEVVTGGASASDEYVEVANAGPSAADLNGLELVYVSATGTTVTRKAVFTSTLLLEPNRHFLVANSAGIYAATADATYSGGLAADGGAVALRHATGEVVDSVGWGTAANAFVENRAAAAPPAKSSIERLPGGSGGNLRDTNDNAMDWMIQPAPIAQSRMCDPVPLPRPVPSATLTSPATPTPIESIQPSPTAPAATDTPAPEDSATPSASPAPTESVVPSLTPDPTVQPTATPTATPAPTATPEPTPTPSEAPSPECTASPSPSPSPTPTPRPSPSPSPAPTDSSSPRSSVTPKPSSTPSRTPAPSATSPTPTPRPSSTPSPSPSVAEPASTTIAAARGLAAGSRVRVSGVVAAGLGLVGDDMLFALSDGSAGIFVRVSSAAEWLEPGRRVEAVGTLAAPYGQLEIRNLVRMSEGSLIDDPEPARIDLDGVGESVEGSLVTVRGTVNSVANDSGHLSLTVGDGTYSVRVFADPLTGLTRSDVKVGDVVAATGVVGQRASGIGRLDGYRIWLRCRTDLAIRTPIEPDPSGAAGTSPPKTASPSTSAGPATELATALGTRGALVDVDAVVTATAGLFELDGPTIVIDDGTASVALILPSGASAPAVGVEVHVSGKVGRWETGPTVRATALRVIGQSQPPEPIQISVSPNSALEWRLVRVYGRIDMVTRAGARWRVELLVNGRRVVVVGEPPAGSVPDKPEGRMATITGIVRRSTSDSAVFQVLPRTPADVRLGPSLAVKSVIESSAAVAAPASTPTSTSQAHIPLSELGSHSGARVTVVGLVTGVADGEATIQDGTGQARIGGTAASTEIELLEPGDAVEVTGTVTEDEFGLLVVADPACVIVLPGELEDAAAAPSASLAWNPAVAAASSSAMPGVDASRRTSATGHSTDLPTFLVVIALAIVLMAVAVVASRGLLKRSGGRSGPVEAGPEEEEG